MNKLEPPSPEDFFPGRFKGFFWGESLAKETWKEVPQAILGFTDLSSIKRFFLLIERPYLASGQIIATKPLTGHLLNGSLVWESPPKSPDHSALGILG